MHTLQIRKLPQDIYLALKAAADRERRSLSQQAIIALEKGLAIPPDFRKRRKLVLEEIKKRSQLFNKMADVDVSDWIRQDRDSR